MSVCRVVVADDVEDLRYLLTRALEASGRFEVVGTAANGREAIDLATALQPDLTLLDLAMPLMDGLEALPRIRAAVPESTVVVLSGLDAETMERTALQRGADGYLVKGLSPRGVVEELLTLLAGIAHRDRGRHQREAADELTRAQIDLPAELTASRSARRFLAERLVEWQLDGLRDTALLLTSELVTNAVIHARSAVSVTIRRGARSLRVEVADTGGGALHFRDPNEESTSGRGLLLMNALAEAWGTSAYETGKLVWFELPASARPVRPPATGSGRPGRGGRSS